MNLQHALHSYVSVGAQLDLTVSNIEVFTWDMTAILRLCFTLNNNGSKDGCDCRCRYCLGFLCKFSTTASKSTVSWIGTFAKRNVDVRENVSADVSVGKS